MHESEQNIKRQTVHVRYFLRISRTTRTLYSSFSVFSYLLDCQLLAMGNTKWTTSDEERYLEINVPQYHAAQQAKKVSQWLLSFFLQWFLKFPDYSNGKNTANHNLVKKVSALH